MAKRRSLNRRWSRRSANSSAVLNDDTNVFEDDSNIWQYLNETNSRPPSILNQTEATEVLGSDSNLVDSHASSSILKYLPKSPEEQQPRTPRNRQKPKEPDAKNREEHSEPTDSDESAKIKKKRVILGRTRGLKRRNNVFSMNSSSSTVDGEPPSHSPQKTQEKSQSQVQPTSPDSDTSVESTEIMKKRPKFKRPASKLIGKSLLASGDDSIVGPSQETRRTSIKARKTFVTGAPAAPVAPAEQASSNITGEESESEPEQLISQKRKLFKSTRRSKKSVNPFTSILEEINTADKEKEDEQHETRDNSNDFVLKVDSINSEEQKSRDSQSKKRKISDVSGSSISEELKIGENSSGKREERIERLQSAANEKEADDDNSGDDDSEEYESIEGEEEEEEEEEEGEDEEEEEEREDEEEGEEEEAVEEKSADASGAKIANENHQNVSVDGGRSNDSRNSRKIVSPHVAEAATNRKQVPDISDDSDDEEIFDSEKTKNLSTSKVAEHQSPIISGSMVEASQESQDSEEETRKSASDNKRVTRSSGTVAKTLNYADGEDEEETSDSEEEVLNDKSKKLSQSHKFLSSQLQSQENRKDATSEEELDVETVSDDEPIFSKTSETIQSQLLDENEETPVKSRNKKAPVAAEMGEPLNTSRPGPRSSKTPKKSEIPPKPQTPTPKLAKTPKKSEIPPKSQTPAPKLAKSPNSTVQRDSPLLAASLLHPRRSSPLKSPETQLSKAPKNAEKNSIKRPGPKSFKKSLSTSRNSETSKFLSPATVQDDTESLSESSSRKISSRKTDPSLYELPPKERSPTPSLSESEQERPASKLRTRPTVSKDAKKSKTSSRSRKIESDSDEEEDEEQQQQSAKKVTSPRRSNAASRQHLLPHVEIIMGDNSETPPIAPVNKLLASVINNNQKTTGRIETNRDKENVSIDDPVPSTSGKSSKGAGDAGAVGAGPERKKLRQLKLDAMMQARRGPQRSLSDSDKSFDEEEFDRKIREIRRKELMKRAENEEAEKAATKRRLEKVKREEEAKNKRAREKLKAAFKRIDEEYRPVKKKPKTVHPAYIVDGKVYKRPKLPRPKHWATDKLYNFLWKKMEPKFGIETRVRSEKFVLDLAEAVTVITRRKKYENYKGELDALLKKMAKLGIIKNRFDFNGFCYDFLPYEFRIKVVSMIQFGNKHNIPFEPDKLMVPIIDDDEDD